MSFGVGFALWLFPISATCPPLGHWFFAPTAGTCCRNLRAMRMRRYSAMSVALETKVMTSSAGVVNSQLTFSRYCPSDDHLRVQTKRLPLRSESEEICGPGPDKRRQEDRGSHRAHVRAMRPKGDVLYNNAIAQRRRGKYGVLQLCLRV